MKAVEPESQYFYTSIYLNIFITSTTMCLNIFGLKPFLFFTWTDVSEMYKTALCNMMAACYGSSAGMSVWVSTLPASRTAQYLLLLLIRSCLLLIFILRWASCTLYPLLFPKSEPEAGWPPPRRVLRPEKKIGILGHSYIIVLVSSLLVDFFKFIFFFWQHSTLFSFKCC